MENRSTIQSIVFAVVLGLTSTLGRCFLGTPSEDMAEDMRRLSERIEVLEDERLGPRSDKHPRARSR